MQNKKNIFLKKLIKLLFFIVAISNFSYASQEVYEIYTVREKAMGATTVAHTKNAYQFNRNSALLSYKKSFKLDLPKISFGLSTDYIDNQDTLKNLLNGKGTVTEQTNELKSLVPMDFSINGAISPGLSITMPNFGVKIYTTSQIEGKLLRKSSPTLYLAGKASTILQAGISKEFFIKNHMYSFGISPKYIFRNTIYDKNTGKNKAIFDTTEIIEHINNISEQDISWYTSSGFGLDLGFATQYEKNNIEGIFGINAKNIISSLSGDKEVNNSDENTTESDPVVVTVGTNAEIKLPILKKVIFATDYDIVAPTQNSFKRFHMGFEKNLYHFLKLRGGINQGFVVGGFSLNFFLIKFDYAYFGEELTSTLGNSPLLTHNLKISLLF